MSSPTPLIPVGEGRGEGAPLRVVMFGAGANIARSHFTGLDAIGAQVVAVQDINRERVEDVAERVGCPAFVSVDEALSVPSEAAVVVAPHPFHAALAIAALQAGRHVLVEKPIAESVDQADRMIEAARRADRLIGVALQHRTREEVRAAVEFVDSGGIGLTQRVDLIGTWPRRRAYFQVAPWRGTWRGEGGGVAINQGQHDLDLLTYLAGSPARVLGWTRTRLHHIETEDTAVAMLEWSNGAVGAIHLSTCEVEQGQRLEITGTAGRLRLRPGRLETVRNAMDFREFLDSPGGPFEAPATLPPESLQTDGFDHVEIYRNFASAIAGQAPLIASGESATVTLELANAILLSSALGRAVDLPLDRTEYAHFLDERRAE